MEERDQSVKEKGTPLRGRGFYHPPLDSALTFSGYISEKGRVEYAYFVIYFEFLSVINQIPCDQGGMPKHVMDV